MNTQLDLINNFFQRFDLTDVEFKLKQRCQNLKAKLDTASGEVQAKRNELVQKEEEQRALSFQLEGLLQFILELETDRTNQPTSTTTVG